MRSYTHCSTAGFLAGSGRCERTRNALFDRGALGVGVPVKLFNVAVVWWEVETPAPEAFQEFHSAMWRWTFQYAFEDSGLGADYWIVREGNSGIGGLQRSPTGSAPVPGVRLYLEVGDLEDSLQRAASLGAVVERERTALGGEDRWFATIADPSGVSFGLWTADAARTQR